MVRRGHHRYFQHFRRWLSRRYLYPLRGVLQPKRSSETGKIAGPDDIYRHRPASPTSFSCPSAPCSAASGRSNRLGPFWGAGEPQGGKTKRALTFVLWERVILQSALGRNDSGEAAGVVYWRIFRKKCSHQLGRGFGVNMLRDRLHSSGFTGRGFKWATLFVVSQSTLYHPIPLVSSDSSPLSSFSCVLRVREMRCLSSSFS